MTTRLLVIVFLACLGASHAHAQVNVETLQQASPRAGWSGEINGSLVLIRGNVRFLDIGGGIRVQWQDLHALRQCDALPFVRERVTGVVNAHLVEGQGERAINQAFALLRYNRMWLRRLGVDGALQYQFDEFLRLERRLVAGAVARLVPIYKEWLQVYLGTGYMLELERLDLTPDGTETNVIVNHTNHRWLNYLVIDVALPGGRSMLQNTLYVQPRFGNFQDVQVLDSLTLRLAITGRVSFDAGFEIQYDSQPPGIQYSTQPPTEVKLQAMDIRVRNALVIKL